MNLLNFVHIAVILRGGTGHHGCAIGAGIEVLPSAVRSQNVLDASDTVRHWRVARNGNNTPDRRVGLRANQLPNLSCVFRGDWRADAGAGHDGAYQSDANNTEGQSAHEI